MFRIRSEQVDYFGRKTRARFVIRTAAWLQEHFDEAFEGLSREEAVLWVGRAVFKAERYAVVEEPEATQLVVFLVLLGLDADERLPWVREALEDKGLTGMGKVRALLDAARAEDLGAIEDFVVLDELDGDEDEESEES